MASCSLNFAVEIRDDVVGSHQAAFACPEVQKLQNFSREPKKNQKDVFCL